MLFKRIARAVYAHVHADDHQYNIYVRGHLTYNLYKNNNNSFRIYCLVAHKTSLYMRPYSGAYYLLPSLSRMWSVLFARTKNVWAAVIPQIKHERIAQKCAINTSLIWPINSNEEASQQQQQKIQIMQKGEKKTTPAGNRLKPYIYA